MKISKVKVEYFKSISFKLKYSTYKTNERKMKAYIFNWLDSKKIKSVKDIKESVMLEWQSYINSLNFSYNYKSSLFYCFSDFFEYCVKRNLIKQNVALLVGNFRDDEIKKDGNIWTINEFKKFISCVSDPTYHALFTFLFFTGTRKGEALALKFSDIDFKLNSVYINKTITRYVNNNQKLITSPKTKSSIRRIKLDMSLINELKQLKKLYNCDENAFVFGNDKSISFTTLERKKNYYCDVANVKKIKIHEFRHSHACLLFENKIDIQDVSKRLGHSNIGMTMNTYLKYLPGNEKRVISTLNSLRQNY